MFHSFVRHAAHQAFTTAAQGSDIIPPVQLLQLSYAVARNRLNNALTAIYESPEWPQGMSEQSFEHLVTNVFCVWSHPFDFLLAMRRLLRHQHMMFLCTRTCC